MNIFKCSISSDKSNNNQQDQQHLATREDPVTHQLILSRKKTKKNQTLPPNSFTLIGTNNKNYIYKPLKKLSSGASTTSDVWQIELIEPHDIKGIYALKRIKLDDIDNYDYRSNLLLKQTIDMNIDKHCIIHSTTLSDLEHLNIVKYYDSFISQNIGGKYLNILQEFCVTSLQKLFDLKQEIPITYQIQWSLHIAQALKYIHDECKIVHRDVKPDNILLKKVIASHSSLQNNNTLQSTSINGNNNCNNNNNNNNNRNGNNNLTVNTTMNANSNVEKNSSSSPQQSKLIIKLADFDYAKQVDLSNAKTFVGSQEYFAPEIINSLNNYNHSRLSNSSTNGILSNNVNSNVNGNGNSNNGFSENSSNEKSKYYYTHKVDIWSYGVVALQLIMPNYRLNIPKFREELQKNPNYVKELLKDHLNISTNSNNEGEQQQQPPKSQQHRKLQSLPNSNNHLYLQCLAQIIVDCLQLDPTARPEAKDIVRNIEIIYYSTYTKFNSPVKPPSQPSTIVNNVNNNNMDSSSSIVNHPPPNSSVLTRTSLSSDKSSSSTSTQGNNQDTTHLLNKFD